ncbi:prefoldin subunit, putative [Candida dubliniensis CD36]|uniref:Prefoldin subunit, putative n=1 Tax=Candida dubliniensis (strain CD36 / ATCC MYA-646 / CBS 7987 / NCPF 3949 / NRRL Y-17841) TaxID=573826 RepID=B9W9B7_CANDC|nr:prefoldin subunit, putative [Candida dubliniensis CD36]CAX45394.1 prefoldin subunit, putative [Candida dubliniensis CD36]
MSTPKATGTDEQKSQILQQEYNRYQELIAELDSQLSTISSQLQEHLIVDQSLTSISPEKREGRKCFKMIGGVLVEKSIDEVIKILNGEITQLKNERERLNKELTDNRKKLESWITTNKIKIVKG